MDLHVGVDRVGSTGGGDAFQALSDFVHFAADERIGALCPMLSEAFDQHHPDLFAARERTMEMVDALMRRAREAGQLRPDVESGATLIAVSQLTRPLPGTACQGIDRFVHRHLQLFLDGLRAPAVLNCPEWRPPWRICEQPDQQPDQPDQPEQPDQ